MKPFNRLGPLELGNLAPTRHSLLTRLKNWDDKESWDEFFNIYWKPIFVTARGAGLTEDEAQDVVQETIISVAKKMPDFKYNPAIGSFKGWLLNLTKWRIQDQLRKRLPAQWFPAHVLEDDPVLGRYRLDADPGAIEEVPDPNLPDIEAAWEAEWERNLFEVALEQVKSKVDPKTYQAFDLYVFQNSEVEDIRALLKLSTAQVYVAKHRVSKLIRKEMQRLEKRMTAAAVS